MLVEPGARCAVLAAAAGEPLAGTAPHAPRWLCLEHRGAWPRDPAEHPDPAVRALAARCAVAGWRLHLVRRPGRRTADGPVRVLLADTTPGTTAATELAVAGPAELAGLPLPEPGAPLPGRPVVEPPLLVCTHGRRDRCCALEGRALATALAGAGEPEVWECSHLGGHRFAPTALVLPTGYLYGRLDPATAVAARKAACLGEVEPAGCRGRSTWTAPWQVAELAVRAGTGLRDADALLVAGGAPTTAARPGEPAQAGGTGRLPAGRAGLSWPRAARPGGAATCADPAPGPAGAREVLVSARDGRRWAVTVRRADGHRTRPASCGAEPAPYTTWMATALRRVG